MISYIPQGWPSLVVGRFLAYLSFSGFVEVCRSRCSRKYASERKICVLKWTCQTPLTLIL